MQRDQRRRTRRVHRHRRPLQIQEIRQPARRDAPTGTGEQQPIGLRGPLVHRRPVVLRHRADEHARVAAAQRSGLDPGVLQRLPHGLQKQSLLRVHRQRLARRHPEEPGVELPRVVEEVALVHVALAGPSGVRVEQVLQIPATIARQPGHGVPTRPHQLPQSVRRRHATGKPAAHPDDGDRIIVLRRGGRSGRSDGLGAPAEQLLAQERGQRGRGRPVERHGGRQPQSGDLVEPLAEFHRGQRVEAELPERDGRLYGVGAGVAEHGGGVGAHQIEQLAVDVLGRVAGQPVGERRRGRRDGGRRAPRPDQPAQNLRQGRPRGLRTQPVQVERDRCSGGLTSGERRVEQRDALVRRKRLQPSARHAGDVRVVQAAGQFAALAPEPPRERGRRKSGGVAVLGERVEEHVRGGVVRLARVADRAHDRGEQHERGQPEVLGQVVQVPRRVQLRREDGVDLLRCHPGDQPVVQGPGGVHHAGERVVRRDCREQCRERAPVGHVARGDRHLGAQPGQLGDQVRGSRGVRSAPGDQQQVPHPVLRDQVLGEQPAECSGTSGEQHGAVGVPP
ncbi:hypothetical protein Save01_09169 [Streptomyces avermitilis]